MIRLLLPAALLLAPLAGSAQAIPDSVRTDTVPAPVVLRGLTVAVPRALATAGGASAVEIRLDSVSPGPAPSMADVLRDMPLIVIRSNSRGEAQPALRGSEDRQVAVIVDGVPLTLGWDARSDLSVIPLTAARRIRLVRGLSTILHGPNVLGGAVEVDVARGSARFAPPVPVSLRLSADHTGSTALALTGGRLLETDHGEWEVRGGLGHHDRVGEPLAGGIEGGQRPRFLSADGDLRLNSDSERLDGFVSARYRAGNGAWFSTVGSGYRVERGVPPEAHVDDPRLWRYPHQSRLVLATSAGTGFHDTSMGRGDLEASVGLDVGRTEIDAFGSERFDEVVGGEDADDRTLTVRVTGDLAPGERTDLRAAITYGDIAHTEWIDGGPATDYRQRLWSLGFEAERRVGVPVPGLGETRVVGGVALDGADTPESADKPPLERLWDWGGRIGFSSLSDGGSVGVHGSLSRRTRFPALRELYSGALGRFEPNPLLGPERLVAGELGLTWTPGEGEMQVVAFHQRLSDGIVRTSVQTDEGPKFKRVNEAQVRSTGLEIMGRAPVGRVMLSTDVTLQHVRGIDADGRSRELEYEPALVARAGLRAPLPLEASGAADVSWLSAQACVNPEADALTPFDSDPRLDVALSRRFSLSGSGPLGRLEARASIENATDATAFDQCGLPNPGRRLSLELRLW